MQQDEVTFLTYRDLYTYATANTCTDKTTYYDPIKGWVLVNHERYTSDEDTLEDCGVS